MREIPFADLEEGFPALLTMTIMPFSYSITNGIGAGFVSYVVIKLVRGRVGAVHPLMYVAAAAFLLYFALHVGAPGGPGRAPGSLEPCGRLIPLWP